MDRHPHEGIIWKSLQSLVSKIELDRYARIEEIISDTIQICESALFVWRVSIDLCSF